MQNPKILLVGDNPFHGVSHLSQNRARSRDNQISNPDYCAELVKIAIENGADGFMFSVSEITLDIIRALTEKKIPIKLYAIAPAASDYVRLASKLGTPGMAIYLAKQIVASGNLKAIFNGFKGVVFQNPAALMKAYLYYEIFRIRKASQSKQAPYCFLLHEIITEMALALNLEWLFKSFVEFMLDMKIKPGFETRNSPLLIDKLLKLGIDASKVVIVAPYNKIGFQMNPSKEECENALTDIPQTEVIAMSILASGYIKPPEAIEYINGVSQLKGVVIGVSREKHAEDFKIFREALDGGVQ
ncbi:MAG TPA: hypothetical protein DCR71_05035 [Dehalococcoidia bacterium]|nr:hypothetical protein [Dehalococcoidia bacterium]